LDKSLRLDEAAQDDEERKWGDGRGEERRIQEAASQDGCAHTKRLNIPIDLF
jgi:hypothetical protein